MREEEEERKKERRRREEEKREVGKRNSAKASSEMGVKRKRGGAKVGGAEERLKNCNGFHASALMVLQIVLRSVGMKTHWLPGLHGQAGN